MVMKPGMTWKIGAVGLAELTGSLTVLGSHQRRQQDRGGDCGLPGPKAELLPSCVTLVRRLPLSGLLFTDWGADTSVQSCQPALAQIDTRGLDQS